MKISNKARYGVRAVFDIAFHSDGCATQIREIAERQAIPPRFLEQIFQDLKRAGLVTSKRGPRGGYALARNADEIRVGDVIRALEGPVALTSRGEQTADGASLSITEDVFAELSTRIQSCLDAVSIASLCERGEASGLRRKAPRRYVYSI